MMPISIHAPHTGRDPSKFICCAYRLISIHAPHTGRDTRKLLRPSKDFISIHAPHTGRDRDRPIRPGGITYFNPRAPYGARHMDGDVVYRNVVFQSTRPIRGATIHRDVPKRYSGISIHAPHTGRDCWSRRLPRTSVRFQSTRPIRGATTLPSAKQSEQQFQSTRPIRGATHSMRGQQ